LVGDDFQNIKDEAQVVVGGSPISFGLCFVDYKQQSPCVFYLSVEV
jgi:hypothetical protein